MQQYDHNFYIIKSTSPHDQRLLWHGGCCRIAGYQARCLTEASPLDVYMRASLTPYCRLFMLLNFGWLGTWYLLHQLLLFWNVLLSLFRYTCTQVHTYTTVRDSKMVCFQQYLCWMKSTWFVAHGSHLTAPSICFGHHCIKKASGYSNFFCKFCLLCSFFAS